jgi:bifunctional DNA-binding transcriptional regulator/antitoxin component of YhaV-PrlF toxin-antitoxin module
MTAKRQATFPKQLCEEMRLRPGDTVQAEPAVLDGRRVWVLSAPPETPGMDWVGSLRRYADGGPHSMTRVRERMMEAMAHGADLD